MDITNICRPVGARPQRQTRFRGQRYEIARLQGISSTIADPLAGLAVLKITSEVGDTSRNTCASSCTIIFAGGVKRASISMTNESAAFPRAADDGDGAGPSHDPIAPDSPPRLAGEPNR